MEHIAAIMMLVGCGYGNVDCRELPVSAVGYETVEDCQSMLRPTVADLDTSANVIYGKCEPVDPLVFIGNPGNPRIRWVVTSQDELHVSVEAERTAPPVMMASAR